MNELIRELALQAQKVVGHTDGGYTEIKVLDQEKFAELIVEECIRICEDSRKLTSMVPLKDDEQITAVVCMIKQHFGVNSEMHFGVKNE